MKKFSPGLLIVAIFTMTQACSSQPKFSDDFRPWEIGVVTPSFYPVMVEKAYGVSEKFDGILPVQRFSAIWRWSDLDDIRRLLPDYDGFGIPLASVLKESQVMQTRVLPDSVYISWASLAESKFYTTKFDLSPEIKQKMMERQRYIRGDGVDRPCYQKDIVFGLLPGGDAKVWISGCYKYTLVGRVKPAVISDTDSGGFAGADNFQYKGWIEDAQQRAADNGVTLFPVPWDKVNREFRRERKAKK